MYAHRLLAVAFIGALVACSNTTEPHGCGPGSEPDPDRATETDPEPKGKGGTDPDKPAAKVADAGTGSEKARPPRVASLPSLEATSLRGRELVSDTSGPWRIRKTKRASAPKTTADRRRTRDSSVSKPVGLGGGAGGGDRGRGRRIAGKKVARPGEPEAKSPPARVARPGDPEPEDVATRKERAKEVLHLDPRDDRVTDALEEAEDAGGDGGPDPDATFEGVDKAADEAPPEEPGEPGGGGGKVARKKVMPKARAFRGPRGGVPPADFRPLRAGATDDNEAYEAFLEFAAKWGDTRHAIGRYDPLNVRDRKYVRVVREDGRPVPAAFVQILDEERDQVAFSGATYGDGRIAFYPHLNKKSATPAGGYLVEAWLDREYARARWDGKGDFAITLAGVPAVKDPLKLDVLFQIDTTGSMGDEIAAIKGTLLKVTKRLESLEREFDLRYAAVLYRDINDEYVTKTHPFTSDIKAFNKSLQAVVAKGGGDGPESLNQGLAEAIGAVEWRGDAAKVMFVIADAPPHMDYAGDVPYGKSLRVAASRGIRIHSVAASGLDAVGTLVFRQIAQFTRGKFIFIEYGSTKASAASHGVKGPVKSNNLDDILFEQIQRELATWGRN